MMQGPLLLHFVSIVLLAGLSPVAGQDGELVTEETVSSIATTPVFSAEIEMADGTIVRGRVLSRTDSSLVIRTPLLGDLTVLRRQTRRITEVQGDLPKPAPLATPVSGTAQATATTVALGEPPADSATTDPGDNALFFMSTAFVPKKGSVRFKDYELFFLTVDFVPTDRLSFDAGCLFPMGFGIQVFKVGSKWQFFSGESGPGRSALALGGFMLMPMVDAGGALSFWNLGGIFSYALKDRPLAFHAQAGMQGMNFSGGFDPSESSGVQAFSWALGTDIRLGRNSKILAEFLNASPFKTESSVNFLCLGFRLFGDRISADLGGMRPFGDGNSFGELFMIPVVNVSYRIK